MAKKKKKTNRSPNQGSSKPASRGGSSADRAQTAPKGRATGSPRDGRSGETLKNRSSWLVLIAGVAGVVGVIGIIVWQGIADNNAGTADVNDWTLPGLDGGEDVALAELVGKPVVLNFFASWCTACEAELPEFNAMADVYGDEVEFIFVNSQENGDWRRMARDGGIDDNTLVRDFGAGDRAMHRALGGRGMPITAFYDADGTLREVSTGALVGGALEEMLRRFGYI
ncbi:MAG: TlpA family protein disulfide reductase [Actinobacteria bacterium]|nr:TlpA family protein disulfide reductase [Actinomycetota bacterium]